MASRKPGARWIAAPTMALVEPGWRAMPLTTASVIAVSEMRSWVRAATSSWDGARAMAALIAALSAAELPAAIAASSACATSAGKAPPCASASDALIERKIAASTVTQVCPRRLVPPILIRQPRPFAPWCRCASPPG